MVELGSSAWVVGLMVGMEGTEEELALEKEDAAAERLAAVMGRLFVEPLKAVVAASPS